MPSQLGALPGATSGGPLRGGVSSFGFCGVIAHAVIEVRARGRVRVRVRVIAHAVIEVRVRGRVRVRVRVIAHAVIVAAHVTYP